MPELAVTAVGRDRPGIVAALSTALHEIGGNIEDSQMSILRGHFAVMLLVATPDDADAGAVADRLERVRSEMGLEAITVSEVPPLAPARSRPTHVITVYGADRPGIVAEVSAALARMSVNVTDLEARLTEGPQPLYAMIAEVELGSADAGALERALAATALDVSVRELDSETL